LSVNAAEQEPDQVRVLRRRVQRVADRWRRRKLPMAARGSIALGMTRLLTVELDDFVAALAWRRRRGGFVAECQSKQTLPGA
jgi:hypothetical protein